jgi:hypothetical protein
LSSRAGSFPFRCLPIKSAPVHEILYRLLKSLFACVQIDIHADARGPISR